jgi:hypothetical protein
VAPVGLTALFKVKKHLLERSLMLSEKQASSISRLHQRVQLTLVGREELSASENSLWALPWKKMESKVKTGSYCDNKIY